MRKKLIDSLTKAERLYITNQVLEEEYSVLKREGVKWCDRMCDAIDWISGCLSIETRNEKMEKLLEKKS